MILERKGVYFESPIRRYKYFTWLEPFWMLIKRIAIFDCQRKQTFQNIQQIIFRYDSPIIFQLANPLLKSEVVILEKNTSLNHILNIIIILKT
jgi:hypothetical protein